MMTLHRIAWLPVFVLPLVCPAAAAAQSAEASAVQTTPQTRGVSALRPDVGGFSLTPFIGSAFSGDLENASPQFGAALGYGANERISLEAEFTASPAATQGTLVIFDTNVWALNGNVVYHFLPADFTPYATIGLGVVGSDPDIALSLLPAEDNATTTFAFNFGAGVKAALNQRLGLRADIRHFNAGQLAPDHWRVYAGLLVRRLGR